MSSPKLVNVSSPRGAPHGRPAFRPADPTMPLKFYLQRIRLNNGGYDSGGAYWGFPDDLYWACSVEEVLTTAWFGSPELSTVESYFRASNREDAKNLLRAKYPNAKFFN